MPTCRPTTFSVPPPPDLPARADRARFAVRLQVPERDPWDDQRAEHAARMQRLRALLTVREQLEAAVPAPLGFEEIKAARASPSQAYNRELRNPIWAPAMEASVSTFLEDVAAQTLPGLAFEVECRTSTCRATLEPGEELARRMREKYPGKGALGIFVEFMNVAGPLGRVLRETMMEDGRVAIVFAFDTNGMPPQHYRDWQRRVAEKTRANLLRAQGNVAPKSS
jgi:hypothetical protein